MNPVNEAREVLDGMPGESAAFERGVEHITNKTGKAPSADACELLLGVIALTTVIAHLKAGVEMPEFLIGEAITAASISAANYITKYY